MSVRTGEPQVIIKKALPNIILKKNSFVFNKKNQVMSVKPLYKEDIVYRSSDGDFLRLKDPAERICVLNRLNLVTMRSHTVAQLTSSKKVVWEKTSEHIASIIGQENYEIVFSTLCSVISQEFKVRAILALLTEPKDEKKCKSTQTDCSGIKKVTDVETQTVESSLGVVKKPQTRRSKRQVLPYVVTDPPTKKVTKVVVHPENFESFTKLSVPIKFENDSMEDSQLSFFNNKQDSEHLSMLRCDENSRESLGNLSIVTTDELMNAPLSLIERVTEVTEPSQSTPLVMLDGTVINVPCRIEDDFHVATPEILKAVPVEHRRKLLWYQAYTDWKYCLTRDDDDNLPIHLAVLNDDVHLLRRQALVLKTRQESVDITNGDNLTALQMSILAGSPLCTALLMQLGANPLVTDDEYRTCFHLAAEAGAEHLDPLIKKCQEDPLSILRGSELWSLDVAAKSKDCQIKYLMHRVCTMFDSQGYTPLMLASKLGKHEAVLSLLKASPGSVDYRSTSSGATALYIAVGAACDDSTQRGNKSKVFDDFKKTIEHLVDAGADPSIENYSGSDVNVLLSDFNSSDLSMIIARKRTAINCKEIDIASDSKPFVIVKEKDGTLLKINQIKKTKEINKIKNDIKKVAGKTKINKPVIIENKVIKPTEDYMSTYKLFVSNMNAPVELLPKKFKKKLIKNQTEPGTSKSAENIDSGDSQDEIIEIKKEIDDLISIKIEKSDETEIADVENTKNSPPVRVSKRKRVSTSPKEYKTKKVKGENENEIA